MLFCGVALPLSTAWGGEAVRLNCLERGKVLVSFFKYHLITMKWGDHFQIASGMKKGETKSGVAYETISFRNGDDLVHFPKAESYLLFDANKQDPEKCRVKDEYTYPVVSLPRYSDKADS